MNLSTYSTLSTTSTHPTLPIIFDIPTLKFKYTNGTLLPILLYQIDQNNYSHIIVRNDPPHNQQIICTIYQYPNESIPLFYTNPYIQWSIQINANQLKTITSNLSINTYKLKQYNQTQTNTYNTTYFYQPKLYNVSQYSIYKYQYRFNYHQYLNYFVQIYFALIITLSIVSTIFFHLYKLKQPRITLNYNATISIIPHNWKQSLIHFFINIVIFILGSIPFLSIIHNSYSIQQNTILAHILSSLILTSIIYMLLLKNWNLHSLRKVQWQADLQWFSKGNYQSLLIKSLKQLQINYSDELFNILKQEMFSIQFINSQKVRKLLNTQSDPLKIKQSLNKYIKHDNLKINSSQQEDSLQNQTWNLVFPQFLIVFILSLFSIISTFLNSQIICLNDLTLVTLCCIFATLSIAHFMWQHYHQIFVKQPNGDIMVRQTQSLDLLKIFILGVLILIPVLTGVIGGYFTTKYNIRFVISLGLGIIGYLISIVIHWYWNYCSGILGIVTNN